MNKFQRHVLRAPEGGEGGSGGGGSTLTGTPPAGGTPPTAGTPPAGGATDWRGSLPEDLRSHPALTDIKDVGGLAKSFVHAQSMIGADKIVMPKPDASPAEMADFYNKLGRPGAAEGYKFSETTVEGVPKDEATQKWARDIFHKHGLTQKQADGLYQDYVAKVGGDMKSMQEARGAQREQALEQLRGEWKGNEFDVNVQLAQRAVKTFGSEELVKYLNDSGEGDNPMLIKLFANIGKQLGEDQAFGGRSSQSGFVAGPEAAKAEIGKLQTDTDFQKAYMNKDAPGHKEAVDRMERLFKVAYPGKVSS